MRIRRAVQLAWGICCLVIGASTLLWIAYNVLFGIQPSARGHSIVGAGIFGAGVTAVGLERIRQGLGWAQRRSEPQVAVDAAGFTRTRWKGLRRTPVEDRILWSEIQTVTASRVKVLVTDDLYLTFASTDGGVLCTEDDEGFSELLDALPQHLRDFPGKDSWWASARKLPLDGDPMLLWQR